jgi:hypothetical protein
MWTQVACDALRSGHVLQLRYDGYTREVEVHAIGFTKENNAVMRVWQVAGGSVSNEPVGFKLLRLDEATGLSSLTKGLWLRAPVTSPEIGSCASSHANSRPPLRQSAELRDYQPARHVLSLLRTRARDVRRLSDHAVTALIPRLKRGRPEVKSKRCAALTFRMTC